MDRDGGVEQLTDELLAKAIGGVRRSRPSDWAATVSQASLLPFTSAGCVGMYPLVAVPWRTFAKSQAL
ncbi:hypothetical protein ACIHAX_35745 [Nocardia sp. NPDC051929]|uniref:hypothetical protein n=1 Tax=Nocardia sp. NPDC051929 TaxID=3364327 RepID=UPI0037CB4A39